MTVLEDTIRKIEEWKRRGYTSLYDHEMRKVIDDSLEILREYKKNYPRICSWKSVVDGTPESGTNNWTWHRCGDEEPKDKSDIILWQGVHFHACFYEDAYGFCQLNEGSWWEFIYPNDDDKWAYIHYNE